MKWWKPSSEFRLVSVNSSSEIYLSWASIVLEHVRSAGLRPMETISTSHHSSGLSSQKSSESPFIRQCVLDLKFMNRIRKLILIFGSFSTEFVLQNFVLQNVFCRILSCRISSSSFCKIRPAGFCLQNSELGFRPVAVFQSVLSRGPPQPDWSHLRRVAFFYTRRRGWCSR